MVISPSVSPSLLPSLPPSLSFFFFSFLPLSLQPSFIPSHFSNCCVQRMLVESPQKMIDWLLWAGMARGVASREGNPSLEDLSLLTPSIPLLLPLSHSLTLSPPLLHSLSPSLPLFLPLPSSHSLPPSLPSPLPPLFLVAASRDSWGRGLRR